MDEIQIINLYKRRYKTDTKAVAKAAPKAPKSGRHLFLREQLDEMTGEDKKSIEVLCKEGGRRSKKILQDYPTTMIRQDR